MTLLTTTVSVDYAGKGKRLASWCISQGAGAQQVNFRSGGAAGPIQFQVQLAANSSSSQSYPSPLVFPNSLYLEVVQTGLARAAVELQ